MGVGSDVFLYLWPELELDPCRIGFGCGFYFSPAGAPETWKKPEKLKTRKKPEKNSKKLETQKKHEKIWKKLIYKIRRVPETRQVQVRMLNFTHGFGC
jgi:hypothetical protein